MHVTNVTTKSGRARGRIGLALAATLGALAALALPAAGADDIPARPEQLKFPPLAFDPPKVADHRIVLKNGVAAYLVPDRDLPLVTVHVLMRIGPDLDPVGKEGLAATMVNQLTRGGTSARSATQIEDRVAFLGAQLESSVGGGGGGPFGPGGGTVTSGLGLATLADTRLGAGDGLRSMIGIAANGLSALRYRTGRPFCRRHLRLLNRGRRYKGAYG